MATITAEQLDDQTVKVSSPELGDILVMRYEEDDGTAGYRIVKDALPGVPVQFG